MGTTSLAWKIVVGIVSPFIVWLIAVALSTLTWVQRYILYLHKAPIGLGTNLHVPESLGFLKNQIAPFQISTPDGISLYAWLIAPLKVYSTHEKEFLADSAPPDRSIDKSAAFNLLRRDPEARLLIYFHGNSATIGQSRRTDEYRTLSSGAPDKIFILTFDYRGFGLSTGSPTEEGVIIDAISVVNWAIEHAGISPNRILLFSQSLGTAVATAVAEHYIRQEPKVEFAGLVLCCPFTAAHTVFLDFAILGKINLLAPLKLYRPATLQYKKWYTDAWTTLHRLESLTQKSTRLRLTLVHAIGDKIIPWRHCTDLFYASAIATSPSPLTRAEVDDRKETYDLGDGGWLDKWTFEDKIIKQRILKYGGHDSIMKWHPLSLLVLRAFELE